jgi:hypothetical protein
VRQGRRRLLVVFGPLKEVSQLGNRLARGVCEC